jgi:hypothetical protein
MKMVSLYDAISRMSESVGDWVLAEKWKFVWPAKEACRKIGIEHLNTTKNLRVLEFVEGLATTPIDVVQISRIFMGDVTEAISVIPVVEDVLMIPDIDGLLGGAMTEFDFTQNKDSIQLNDYYTGTCTLSCIEMEVDADGMLLIPEVYMEAFAIYLEAVAMKMMKWKILNQNKMLRSGLREETVATEERFWREVRALKSNRTTAFRKDVLPKIKSR